MSIAWLAIELVDAWTLYVGLEGIFICPFTHTAAAGGAAEVTLSFLQGVLAGRLLVFLLLGNDLGSCELLLNWLVWALLFEAEGWLCQPFFNG